MSKTHRIFWPTGRHSPGTLVGWSNDLETVVAGIIQNNDVEAIDQAISKLNTSDVSLPKQCSALTFAKLGTLEGKIIDATPDPSLVQWNHHHTHCRYVLYNVPSASNMRYYSFLPLGRQAVGDVRKLGQGTNARSRKGSRIDLQLSLNPEVNWCRSLSSGISQESLDKINSASLMMRTLNKHLTSSSSVTFPSLFANTLYHAYTTWENSTISNALKHLHTTFVPKSLLDNSAAVKGLSARLGQFRALAYHALAVLRTAETERATHYMLLYGCLWLMLNDIIVGAAFGKFLINQRHQIARYIFPLMKYATVDYLRIFAHWLDNWPLGVKLNTELSHFCHIFISGMTWPWEKFLVWIEPHLSIAIYLIGLAGFTGMTSSLTVLLDITTILTVHIHLTYLGTKKLFNTQWRLALSMFRLFQGKRFNALRNRLDSWQFDLDQLLLGVMLFSLACFLLPTVLAYHCFLSLIKYSIISFEVLINVILRLVNRFPLFALTLRLKDPARLPDGMYFKYISSTREGIPDMYSVVTSPLSFFDILKHSITTTFES